MYERLAPGATGYRSGTSSTEASCRVACVTYPSAAAAHSGSFRSVRVAPASTPGSNPEPPTFDGRLCRARAMDPVWSSGTPATARGNDDAVAFDATGAEDKAGFIEDDSSPDASRSRSSAAPKTRASAASALAPNAVTGKTLARSPTSRHRRVTSALCAERKRPSPCGPRRMASASRRRASAPRNASRLAPSEDARARVAARAVSVSARAVSIAAANVARLDRKVSSRASALAARRGVEDRVRLDARNRVTRVRIVSAQTRRRALDVGAHARLQARAATAAVRRRRVASRIASGPPDLPRRRARGCWVDGIGHGIGHIGHVSVRGSRGGIGARRRKRKARSVAAARSSRALAASAAAKSAGQAFERGTTHPSCGFKGSASSDPETGSVNRSRLSRIEPRPRWIEPGLAREGSLPNAPARVRSSGVFGGAESTAPARALPPDIDRLTSFCPLVPPGSGTSAPMDMSH